jgi:hypothetical protein
MQKDFWKYSTLVFALLSLFAILGWINEHNTSAYIELGKPTTTISLKPVDDTLFVPYAVATPTPAKIIRDTIYRDSLIALPQEQKDIYISHCAEKVTYSDTIAAPKQFIAVISDTLQNNAIIGRSFALADLRDSVSYHTQNTVVKSQPMLKVYLGIYGKSAFAADVVRNFGGGGTVDFVIKDNVMIGLQGGINSQLQGEAALKTSLKISFKKQP